MNTLVSGSHGLVGTALLPYLGSKGHSLKSLVRTTPVNPSQIRWDPHTTHLPEQALEGIDAVVHLAGEGIATGRWTADKKRAIYESRVAGTRTLSEALARMKQPPQVLVCASAIGYYGNRGSELLNEESAAGTGYLADVCKAWEGATAPAAQKGIRVVHLRFGIILSAQGGALGKMLLPFQMGVGGIIGSGSQYMSWVSISDTIGAIAFALDTPSLRGAVNVVAPTAVTNLEFTKTLGKVLKRPTLFPMPAFAARLAFGEMADALLLSSVRVDPIVLLRSRYHFQWGDLESALHHLLNK